MSYGSLKHPCVYFFRYWKGGAYEGVKNPVGADGKRGADEATPANEAAEDDASPVDEANEYEAPPVDEAAGRFTPGMQQAGP